MLLKNLLKQPFVLALITGCFIVLAFPKFELLPFILLFPPFLVALISRCKTRWGLLLSGFFVSFLVVGGGFYWVAYVLHEFGYMPWALAIILFLGFCSFGALNFPLFTLLAGECERSLQISKRSPNYRGLWLAIGFPAIYTVTEYLIPKLFPVSMGHCAYRLKYFIQIAEITGSYYFIFCFISLGAVVGGLIGFPYKIPKKFIAIPLSLFFINVSFSAWRINEQKTREVQKLTVSLIQANIGNFDKVASEKGVEGKLESILGQYFELSDKAILEHPETQLIVWPETAVPFSFQRQSPWTEQVWARINTWKRPLVTGGFALGEEFPPRDFNGAFLLEPEHDHVPSAIYFKNILLAFGEYMPFGEVFPILYRYFPEVSNFARGTTQNVFMLRDGTRLGIHVCYEAILPEYVRRVVKNNPHLLLNITNDSWFGPTAEPYLHGALAVFRAVEHRLPLIRATNTGTSFVVDRLGEISQMTPVYEKATLTNTVEYLKEPYETFYQKFGEWFVMLSTLAILLLIGGKKYAPLAD